MAGRIRLSEYERRDRRRRRLSHKRQTWLLPPPADLVTPAVAACWMRRSYPGLAAFARVRDHAQNIIRRKKDREDAARCMAWIDRDVARIAAVCGRVLATGRPVPMYHLPPWSFDDPRKLRILRAALRFEKWSAKYEAKYQRHTYDGVRPTLEHAIETWVANGRAERLADRRAA